jgi:hypothetical protein
MSAWPEATRSASASALDASVSSTDTPGWRRCQDRRTGASRAAVLLSAHPMRSCPSAPRATAQPVATTRSAAASAIRASAAIARPAAVGRTPRGRRSTTGVPSSRSSAASWCDSAGCERWPDGLTECAGRAAVFRFGSTEAGDEGRGTAGEVRRRGVCGGCDSRDWCGVLRRGEGGLHDTRLDHTCHINPTATAVTRQLHGINYLVSLAAAHANGPVTGLDRARVAGAFDAKVIGPILLFSGVAAWRPALFLAETAAANPARRHLLRRSPGLDQPVPDRDHPARRRRRPARLSGGRAGPAAKREEGTLRRKCPPLPYRRSRAGSSPARVRVPSHYWAGKFRRSSCELFCYVLNITVSDVEG